VTPEASGATAWPWYAQHANLVVLVQHLTADGWEALQTADVVEKA
jgi:hypothetical protein